VAVFLRPVAEVLSPPVALAVDPENESDLADFMDLTWLNGGAYDSVRVRRDGMLLSTLDGSATSYQDTAPRGPHVYSVEGVIGSATSLLVFAPAFAGILECFLAEDLEADASAFQLDAPWARTSALASSGSFSLTDSPAGNYGDNRDVSAEVIVPLVLATDADLEFDHICITEATFDFGHVEISSDFGATWTELARYDMDDHAGWNDGTALAGDFVHETISLAAYAGEKVRIRFRLVTDPFVTEDGWYVDNITVADTTCSVTTSVPGTGPAPASWLRLAGANPFRSHLDLTLSVPPGASARVQVFDTRGRLLRTLWDGEVPVSPVPLRWDGRDAAGRPSAGGVYLVRALGAGASSVVRVVRMP
jgi:hypothetical protein